MKTNKSPWILLAVALALALGAQAASTRHWKGQDGDWSDNSKWKEDRYGTINNHLDFSLGGTVNVDGAYTNYNFIVWSNAVSFVGNGIAKVGGLNLLNAAITVGDDVTFDFSTPNNAVIQPMASENVSVVVKDEAHVTMPNLAQGLTNLVVRDNATFVQFGNDGTAIQPGGVMSVSGTAAYSSAYDISIPEGAVYAQTGGTVTGRKMSVAPSAKAVFSNGSLTLDELSVSGDFTHVGGTLVVKKLTVPAGSSFELASGTWAFDELNVSGTFVCHGGVVTVGKATLENANLILSDTRLTLGIASTAKALMVKDVVATGSGGIVFDLASGRAPGRYVILQADFGVNFKDLPVSLAGACEGWKVYAVGHYVVLMSTFDPGSVTIENPHTWIGDISSAWGTAANWQTEQAVPVADTSVYLLGWGCPIVTNDVAGRSYLQIINYNDQDKIKPEVPIAIRGEEIELTGALYKSRWANVGTWTGAEHPVFFDCPIVSKSVKFASYAFGKDGSPGLVYNGGLKTRELIINGRFYLGSTGTVSQITYSGEINSNSRGHVFVLKSGVLQITNQTETLSRGFSVSQGGQAYVMGTKFAWDKTLADSPKDDHRIDGELTVEAPYASFPVDQEFQGSGTIHLPAITAEQTGTSRKMVLDGSFTMYLKGFVTAHGGELYRALSVTGGDVTLGAEQDWTYGPDAESAGTRTSTAADRAVQIAEGASLTVSNADTTVTFAEPVTGTGTLKKAGTGTLVLAAGSVADETSLAHVGGTLTLCTVQSFDSASFAEGACIAFAGDLAAAVSTDWTTVLTATTIEGVDGIVSADYKFRAVAVSGGFALQARKKGGLIIILR